MPPPRPRVYVHYFFAVVVIVGTIIIFRERRTAHELTHALKAHAVLAVLCLPIFWFLPADLSHQAGPTYASYSRFGINL